MKKQSSPCVYVSPICLMTISFILSSCSEENVVTNNYDSEQFQYCSGTGDLWLGFQYYGGTYEGGAGNTLFEENGNIFFVIDDSCRYFAFDGTDGEKAFGGLADIRTGLLSQDEAADIAESIKLNRFIEHFGNDYLNDASDCSNAILYDKNGAFSCYCGCPSFSEPKDMTQSAKQIAQELVKKGKPLLGSLRVISLPHVNVCDGYWSVYLKEEVPQTPPNGFDPSASAIGECVNSHNNATQSVLIEGEIAASLRNLRKEYRETLYEKTVRPLTNRIPMQVGDSIFDVYLRDFISLEDQDGLLCPHNINELTAIDSF